MDKRTSFGIMALCLCCLCLTSALPAIAQDQFCGMSVDTSQSLVGECTPLLPDAIDTVRVLIVFVKPTDAIFVGSCSNDPDDGWPVDSTDALPPYAGRLVCPTLEIAGDPDQNSAYPYRGNLTYFYFDMSGGKHVVWGDVFPRTIRLAHTANWYDLLDNDGLNNNGYKYANEEVLDSIDVEIDFADPIYHQDGDNQIDMPLILIYRYAPGNALGPPAATLELNGHESCYTTDNALDGAPVKISKGLGIAQEGSFFSAAMATLLHEWGHQILGDAWSGCDV